MIKKLRIGSLGVSGHLTKRVIVPIKKIEQIEFSAIASRSIEKSTGFAQQWNIPKAYGSYEELLADTEIDAVYIPLPNHMHTEWIKKAADAKKHILCEKPLTLNAKEAEEVSRYTAEKGVKLMEAFMYRFQPQWIRAKELIQIKDIGNIKSIHTHFSYNNPDPNNIRNIFEYGGGALMDIGCYAISVPRFLLGKEPSRLVSCVYRDSNFKTDILTSSIMDFDGVICTFTVSTQMGAKQEVSIIGDAGEIKVNLPFNTFTDVSAILTINNGLGKREIKFHPYDQYGLLFKAFADSILENKPIPTSIEDAIHNMKVIDAVIESEKTGGWVRL